MDSPDLPPSVFIIGAPRSGTSVLFKTLASHPDFASTTNLTRRLRANFALVRAAELVGRKHRPVEASDLWKSFVPDGTVERDASDLTEEHRRTLARIACGHVRHFGRPVFLAKNPGLVMAVRWLAEGLPTSRFIHLVRDGRAVAHSILRQCRKRGVEHWAYMGTRLWPELAELDSPAYSGAIWSHVSLLVDRALGSLPASRALTLRYEDFVREPERALERAASFSGARWSAEHAGLLPRIRDGNRRWVERITPAEREQILEQARPGLDHFGYA